MGKRKQREKAAGEAFTEALFGAAATTANKADESLFFVDNAATETKAKKARRLKAARKGENVAPTEAAIARKLANQRAKRPAYHATASKAAVVESAARASFRASRAGPAAAPEAEIEADLWADEGAGPDPNDWTAAPYKNPHKKSKRPTRRIALPAPEPGQSYNPSIAAQQALVRVAVDIETKKQEKIAEDAAWWARRAAIQNQPYVPENTLLDESSDDDEGGAHGESFLAKQTSRERMTRARRNRQRRRVQAEGEKRGKDSAKKTRIELEDIKALRKGVAAKEREDVATRAAVAKAKAETPIVAAPTEPPLVPLLDELTDSLRSNRAVKAGNVIGDLAKAMAAAHAPTKRSQPKKQRRVKYRGAKIINRYRKPWIQ